MFIAFQVSGLLLLLVACNPKGFNFDSKSGGNNPPNGGQPLSSGAPGTSDGVPGSEGGIEYPYQEYFGHGFLQVYGTAIVNEVNIAITEKDITQTTKRFNARDPGEDPKVNERVTKLVGSAVFQRASNETLKQLEAQKKLVYESYVLFVDSSVSKTAEASISSKFDPPIPAAIVPADISRYDNLKKQPAVFRTRVTQDGGASFDAVITITYRGGNAERSNIYASVAIPQDQRGELYQRFPISSTNFLIDHQTKRLMQMQIDQYFEYDGEKRLMNLNMELCLHKFGGKEERFSCQR